MGKRKRNAEPTSTPPPPEFMPYSSQMEPLPKKKSSYSVENVGLKSLQSIIDSPLKLLPNANHSSNHHQHHGFSRALLLKHPRHFYGRQYSRRKSNNNDDASTSHSKGMRPWDEKWSFKLASQWKTDSGQSTENKEKPFHRSERIRSGSLAKDTITFDGIKIACELCKKLLKKKPFSMGNTLSFGDLSVVAVLVCGHIYHADCLEQRTSFEDRRDPPCPLCGSSPAG